MRRQFILALPFLVATYCSQPTKEKIDLSKARASLRLADGSTISRDSSEEYSPYLVKMDDGHLVLVFGSNRTDCGSCSGHNLFFARSLTVFDGLNLPFFATPSVLNVSVTPMNAGGQINFAVKKNGTGIRVYVNLATASDFIRYADVTNVSSPTVSGWTNITNTNHESNSIIGISADGIKLYSTDFSGIGYAFDPGNANAASAFGIGMDNATSAAPVRQENAGYEDALFGVSYGSTYAAAGAQYFGPIFEFDISLAANGLAISKMSTFVADNAADDLLLFSAFDFFGGGTEDLYVVTSHTSQGLWQIAGFVGFDFTLPAAPPADHWYNMFAPATSCPDVGIGMTPWSATCTNITDSPTGSYNGTEAGEFGGTAYMTIAGQDVGNFFSISAWVNITAVSACTTSCVIVANSALGANTAGFRLYVNSSGAVVLESGNGSAGTSISTNTGLITDLMWNHVTISVDRMSGFATLYVNGFDEGTSNTIRTDFTTSADLSFGAPVGGANPLTGLMDEIKIFGFPVDATIAELLYYE